MLAGLGAVGLASAGAGLGTSAYFNDTEYFNNNRLRAGELDLKVDWEAFYYGASETLEPIGAFPTKDGKTQAPIYTREQIARHLFQMSLDQLNREQRRRVEHRFREQFADRGPDEPGIFRLHDVKPGDWGEATFSLHLFDNPAYLWLGGKLTENAENGMNEPERNHSSDTTEQYGELADALRACIFYDENGNNQFDESLGRPVCIELVLDTSGSMKSGNKAADTRAAAKAMVNALEDAMNADDGSTYPHKMGVTLFNRDANTVTPLTNDVDDLNDGIDKLVPFGSTRMDKGIRYGARDLAKCEGKRIMVILTNGSETGGNALDAAKKAKEDGHVDQFITIGVETPDGSPQEMLLKNIADLTDGPGYFDVDDSENLTRLFKHILKLFPGDTKIVREGSLREVLNDLCIGVPLDGDRRKKGRQCYENSTTQYFAMKWWLPVEVGNEVQSDSVEWNLQVYAEQCRHNDGSNMPFATVDEESTVLQQNVRGDIGSFRLLANDCCVKVDQSNVVREFPGETRMRDSVGIVLGDDQGIPKIAVALDGDGNFSLRPIPGVVTDIDDVEIFRPRLVDDCIHLDLTDVPQAKSVGAILTYTRPSGQIGAQMVATPNDNSPVPGPLFVIPGNNSAP